MNKEKTKKIRFKEETRNVLDLTTEEVAEIARAEKEKEDKRKDVAHWLVTIGFAVAVAIALASIVIICVYTIGG